MAISFACPSCEENLKVRDELAGKRVKCPGCGEPVPVPGEDEAPAEEEERLRKKARRDGDDDRPRKKKKKQKDNTLLYVGIGGGVLAVLLLIGCGIGALFYFKGDDKKTADVPKKTEGKKDDGNKDQGKKDPPKVDNPRPKGGIPRGMDIHDVKNMFKQIGLAYHNYVDTYKRGPAKVQDISPFYEKVAAYDKALSDGGFIVFLWNVRPMDMVDGTSNTILAYERDPDERGARVVLFGDGSVDVLGEELFQKTPKAQARK